MAGYESMLNKIVFAAMMTTGGLYLTPCFASPITGTSVTFTTSSAGITTITNQGETGTVPARFAFCVGPNLNNCQTSGLLGAVSLTDTQLQIGFFDVFIADGSFTLNFTGFGGLLRAVTLDPSSSALRTGSFGLTSFNPSGITLSGYANSSTFTTYDGTNHPVYVFDLTTETAPEPASLLLSGLGAVGIALLGRRRRSGPRANGPRSRLRSAGQKSGVRPLSLVVAPSGRREGRGFARIVELPDDVGIKAGVMCYCLCVYRSII